jgi:muconolactone D-isomerase
MEFLADMVTTVPAGTSDETVEDTKAREAVRARELIDQGHLLRLWKPPRVDGEWRTWGLFRAEDEAQLLELLDSLPLHPWMHVDVTALGAHPNDPGSTR